MKWWDRLARLLRDRDMRPADLARATGINPKLIYKYLDGKVNNPRGDVLRRIAAALGTTEQELLFGVAVGSGLVELKRIPLVTLEQLGTLRRGRDPRSVWDGVSVVAVTKDVTSKAIGVQLDDESNEPEFKAGEVIVVDPTKPPTPGRFVVAVREDLKRAVFGRYQPLNAAGSSFRVVPTHEFFPPVEVDKNHPGFVVARAVKHIRDI